ncbi:hypothetical protein BC826DRAFT_497207 [Russula brevipes]|nr:hypothetical protein BC826DRAFT_497207 [Russula brevipes]
MNKRGAELTQPTVSLFLLLSPLFSHRASLPFFSAVVPETTKAEATAEGAEPAPEAAPATEEAKPTEAAPDAKKEDVPKSPSLLSKLLASFKNVERKSKGPKSPKKEKKEDIKGEAQAEEPPKTEAAPSADAPKVEEATTEAAKESGPSDAPADTSAEPAPAEEKKVERRDVRQTAAKVGRRLSSRVNELFKVKKTEIPTQPKVDEQPPKIEEPTPVAPLENPATSAASEAAPAPTEEPKVEAPPVAAVVAAAA